MLLEAEGFPRMDPTFHCPEAYRKVQSLIEFSKNKLKIWRLFSIPRGDGNEPKRAF
ncbi:hypothetical protein C812_00205 [Paenibacillus barengoltzii G22]|jgi:hypothetical protein|uniref:Uncharacterized protein n=1 Tax=Paenibacillus barengoltzii G22 TaxID=1235795 RepID=R9L9J1_9BACL|nr:hypothetical protein C812_02581 [Paenibacillus barengoltzii G22]EOS57337.1 hypothetical protein C812_01657 [Paenibacillus barengoltzii G22]EOS58860.1 hypothetical protein C812_00205 [Paenibacillus barengoltzii G22]